MAYEKNKCNVCTHYTDVCSEIGRDDDRNSVDKEEIEKVHEKIEDKFFGEPYLVDSFRLRCFTGEYANSPVVYIAPHGHHTDIAAFFELIDLSGALNEICGFSVSIKLKCSIKQKHGGSPLTTRLKMKHAACFKLDGDFMPKIIACFIEPLKDYEYCVAYLKIGPDCAWWY